MTHTSPIYGHVQGHNWHLRPEAQTDAPDIAGILVLNGAKVLYLNQIAYNYVDTFLRSRQNHRHTVWKMALRHLVSPQRTRADWQRLYTDLLTASAGCCEGTGIQILGAEQPFSAPLRVDLALTYRCNNDCTHCYAGGSRETAELTTQEWQDIITKLHTAGVPQIIFTGGESLLRSDLEELLSYAKSRHLITGLITNGRLLTPERVSSLAKAGLDFVQITVESVEPDVHNAMVGFGANSQVDALAETLAGVRTALNSSIRVTTNTTITQINEASAVHTISQLIALGVERIGVNGIIRAERGIGADGITPAEMHRLLRQIRTLCLNGGAEMYWFTPTCYQELNPISLELGVKSCSAASTVLTIEPTGRVLPCQSYFEGLGDARTDSLEQIWNHPLALHLRERQWASQGCQVCKHFQACGGGCPLEQGCSA